MAAFGAEKHWQEQAQDVLMDALAKRQMTYGQFADLLGDLGVSITAKTLTRRINRGTFDAGFLLLCLHALGAEKVGFNGRYAEPVLRGKKSWTVAGSAGAK